IITLLPSTTPTLHHNPLLSYFFFNDTATTEIYTLSLHDALPIYQQNHRRYNNIKIYPAEEITIDNRGHVLAYGINKTVKPGMTRSEEHTSELQSPCNLVCRLLLEKKKKKKKTNEKNTTTE